MNISNLQNIIDFYGKNTFEEIIRNIDLNKNKISHRIEILEDDNIILFIVEFKHHYQLESYVAFEINGKVIDYQSRCYCENIDCSHTAIAIVLATLNYQEIIKQYKSQYELTTQGLFELFDNKPHTKLQTNLTLQLRKINEHDDMYEVTIKVGLNKLYVLKNNINEFLSCFHKGHGSVSFGKNFVYDASQHFFSPNDEEIINMLPLLFNRHYYGESNYNLDGHNLRVRGMQAEKLLDLLKRIQKPFILDIDKIYSINQIESDYSPAINIISDEEKLLFSADIKDYISLLNNNSYILTNNQVYYLTPQKIALVKKLSMTDKIIINSNEINDFKKRVIPNIRKISSNIIFSDDLKEQYKIIKPKIKLFFDQTKDTITCKATANYDNTEINILEVEDINVIRDKETESEAENYLLSLGFKINEKDKIYEIKELETAVEFLENKINTINEYESFVTNALKDVTYIKRPVVKGMFSLGKDELLKCDFNVSDISNEELISIMETVKFKKRYHRLKNGSIINVENNTDLEKMDAMINALGINYKDLKNNTSIKIPKFKALYISSKKEQYDFIETDNDFNQFIKDFETAKKINIDIPCPQKYELRNYQESGIKWMITIANYNFGGILADEMGLGKTVQTIMYIKWALSMNQKHILICSPTSLIYNWEAEFNKFAPEVKVKVIADIKNKRKSYFEEINDTEVLITSYGLLREDLEDYHKYEFDSFIIDEAQAIKNINTRTSNAVKQIKAKHKFALTGTPIENSIVELYSIFDFIMPGYFGSIGSFQRKYNNIIKDSNEHIQKELNSLIAPFILRRKKKDVIKELPDKIEENIIVELGNYQKKLYLSEVKKIEEELDKSSKDNLFEKNKLVILQHLTRLRQFCISPNLCVSNYEGESSKIDNLIDILKNAVESGHKVLVFSQFVQALSLVKKAMQKESLSYLYIDGSVNARARLQLVDKFNVDKSINVFLLSLKAAGNGLNLTSADIVIHLDPWWNPAVEEQATDRAHRIGQQNVVQVIKLIAKGTIEEKIVKLQQLKKELSEKVIDNKENSDIILSRLTADDIKYLISTD